VDLDRGFRRTAQGSGALKKGDTVSLVGNPLRRRHPTAERALTGTPDRKGPGDRPGGPSGFPGHGPWGRDDAVRVPHPVRRQWCYDLTPITTFEYSSSDTAGCVSRPGQGERLDG